MLRGCSIFWLVSMSCKYLFLISIQDVLKLAQFLFGIVVKWLIRLLLKTFRKNYFSKKLMLQDDSGGPLFTNTTIPIQIGVVSRGSRFCGAKVLILATFYRPVFHTKVFCVTLQYLPFCVSIFCQLWKSCLLKMLFKWTKLGKQTWHLYEHRILQELDRCTAEKKSSWWIEEAFIVCKIFGIEKN